MYTSTNYKTKKAVREAIASGKRVTYFQVGPFGGNEPRDGPVYLEGPHYPQPHRWYGQAIAKDGVLISIK